MEQGSNPFLEKEVWTAEFQPRLLRRAEVNNMWNYSSDRVMNRASQRAIDLQSTNSMKIIMWNVRGAGSPQFKNHLLNHVNLYKPGIVILVETKISGDRARAICESLPFNNFKIVDPDGFKGGIWVLWDEAQVQLEYISSSLQIIHMTAKGITNCLPGGFLDA